MTYTLINVPEKFYIKRVRCIDGGKWYETKKRFFGLFRKVVKGPLEDDELHVEREYWVDGELYYDFIEWPSNNDKDGFCASSFETIDDID